MVEEIRQEKYNNTEHLIAKSLSDLFFKDDFYIGSTAPLQEGASLQEQDKYYSDLYGYQRLVNNLITNVRTRYSEGISAPHIDFDLQGNYVIRREGLHSHVDSKDTNYLKAFHKISEFMNTHKEFEQLNRSTMFFILDLKKHVQKIQIDKGTRHPYITSKPMFDLGNDILEQKKISNPRHQDMMRSIYNLLGPVRIHCFTLLDDQKTLQLNDFGKEYIFKTFQSQIEEYKSSENRSIGFGKIFPGISYDKLLGHIKSPNDMNIQTICKACDYLTVANQEKKNEKKNTHTLINTLHQQYTRLRKKRGEKKGKRLSYLLRQNTFVTSIFNVLEDGFTQSKKNKLTSRMYKGMFSDSQVLNRYVEQMYAIDEVDDIVENNKDSIPNKQKLEEIEKAYGVSIHLDRRTKDWYSIALKLLRSSDKSSISDLLGVRILYSQNKETTLSDQQKSDLFVSITSEVISGIGKLSGIHSEGDVLFSNKGEVNSSFNDGICKKMQEKVNTLNFKEKKKGDSNTNTGSNGAYTDMKFQLTYMSKDSDTTIPAEIQFQEVKACEKNEAIHANLQKQKSLDYQCRERTFFTLEDYTHQVSSMITKHMISIKNTIKKYSSLYKKTQKRVHYELYEKAIEEAGFTFPDGSSINFLNEEEYIIDTGNGPEISNDVIRKFTCHLLQKELSESRYTHYLYQQDALRQGLFKLHKKQSSGEEKYPTIQITDCFNTKGEIIKNPSFVSSNYRNQMQTGHISRSTYIGIPTDDGMQTYHSIPSLVKEIKPTSFLENEDKPLFTRGNEKISKKTYKAVSKRYKTAA